MSFLAIVSNSSKEEKYGVACLVFMLLHAAYQLMSSSKRPATGGEDPLDISGLPTTCRIHILNFLAEEDLVTMTLVSKEFHRDCHHTGIEKKIVPVFEVTPGLPAAGAAFFGQPYSKLVKVLSIARPKRRFCRHEPSPPTTFKLMKVLSAARSKSRFSSYRHLIVSGVDHYEDDLYYEDEQRVVDEIMTKVRLEGIVSLDLSVPYQVFATNLVKMIRTLSKLLPNLREVDLSNLDTNSCVLNDHFVKECPLLEKVTWHGRQSRMDLYGYEFQEADGNLKELYSDGSKFYHLNIAMMEERGCWRSY